MKRTSLCLLLLALASGGCFTLTKGAQQTELGKPPAAEIEAAEPPAPVKPEEVNEANTRDALKRLEAEITFDEGPAPKP